MKLLVVGSRSITNIDIAPYIPKDTDTIISGGANGIDTLAEQYADKHKLSKNHNTSSLCALPPRRAAYTQ
ncbi:MAG: hypothetical protein LIO53_07580 [Oscillospiraceae bacterium]|nr:hypothetical protein [Oscillospiraceae bacterium]